jgi:Flp pilus assembly protein TadG
MTEFLPSLRSLARRFRDDRSGVAIVEFAFVLPVMLTLYLGCIAVTIGVSTDRKLSLLTHSLADLVAQDDTIMNTETDDIFLAAKAIMMPYDVTPNEIGMRVQSVRIKADRTACVEWSVAPTGLLTARGLNENVTSIIPDDLRVADTTLIWAETQYNYRPVVGEDLVGTLLELKSQNFMRPRLTDAVAFSPDPDPGDCPL